MNKEADVKEAATRSTTRQVANSAHDMIDAAATKAEKAEMEMRQRAEAVSNKAEATQEQAVHNFEKVLSSTEGFVKEKPIAAAGLAFAAGVVATAILRR